MRFIETKFFMNQLSLLSNKYPMIYDDYEDLKIIFDPTFSTWLGDGCYKQRSKNSSIPTWTRWGFRFIIKVLGDKALPLLVYSKTMKQNVTSKEIKEAIKVSLDELLNNK